MSLPKIDTPRYELSLPSQDIKVQYRPFLVKEEKILLIALESKDTNEMTEATKQIVNACTFNKLDVENLPLFDLEYIFLNIRAKSVGEISKFKVLCPDDKKTYADVEVDLTTVNVEVDDKHSNRVLIDEKRNLGIVMKYPTLGMLKKGLDMENATVDELFDTLIDCVDHIFEGEKIYPAKDTTKQELKSFFDDLSQDNFNKVKLFYDTMPKLRHELEVENPKTKVKSKIVLQGLNDFFELASPTTA